MDTRSSLDLVTFDIQRLVEVGDLIQKGIQAVVEQHTKETRTGTENGIPSWPMYEAQRAIIAATGTLVELVSDPSMRLMEYSGQYWESRALAIAAAKRIPDLLSTKPLPLSDLSRITGVDSGKLARVLRCLCSSHIFSEPEPEVFGNNRISRALVNNEPLRAYIMMFHGDFYRCCEHLPSTLFDKQWTSSYDVRKTAFQRAFCTPKSRWEWLEEAPSHDKSESQLASHNYPGIPGEDPVMHHNSIECYRPELALFSMGMVGGGRVTTRTHLEDYPWQDLGSGKIVDIGGGVGGFMIELSKRFPPLKFVIQDRTANMKLAEYKVWPQEHPEDLSEGKVKFMVHDFFTTNPVHGADIYWLRYVLHDWDDSNCIKILSRVRESMTPSSRILICEQVMQTTTRSEASLVSTSSCLPPNYGVHKRYSHQRDLNVMASINGIQRTPDQFNSLFRQSGLALKEIWPCRSQVSILEVVCV